MRYINKISEILENFDINNYKEKYLYFSLSLSILEGEYYSDKSANEFYTEILGALDKILDKIKLCNKQVKDQISQIIIEIIRIGNSNQQVGGEKVESKKSLQFLSEELDIFQSSISNYKSLISRAKFDFENYNKIDSLHETKEIVDLYELKLFRGANIKSLEESLLMINISLAEIDMNLDCSSYTLKKVELCKDYLSKYNNRSNKYIDFIIDVLLDKSDFLLYKIYSRKLKQSKENRLKEDFYSEKLKKIAESNNYFSQFINACKKHYFEILAQPVFDDSEVNSTSKIHDSCKYYRQKENCEQIRNLQSKLIIPQNGIMSFDFISYESTIKFITNSRIRIELERFRKNNFSLLLSYISENKIDEFFIKELGFNFGEKNALTQISNGYYPYKILLDFFDNFFNFLLKDPLKLLSFGNLEKLNNGENIDSTVKEILFGDNSALKFKLEEYLDNISQILDYGFTYCNIKKLKSIYMPLIECKIKISIESQQLQKVKDTLVGDLELFLDSSYILPEDYDSIKFELKDLSWD